MSVGTVSIVVHNMCFRWTSYHIHGNSVNLISLYNSKWLLLPKPWAQLVISSICYRKKEITSELILLPSMIFFFSHYWFNHCAYNNDVHYQLNSREEVQFYMVVEELRSQCHGIVICEPTPFVHRIDLKQF